MKIEKTDIQSTINYYSGCIGGLQRRMYLFQNCSDWQNLLDHDLYDTQVERYRSKN